MGPHRVAIVGAGVAGGLTVARICDAVASAVVGSEGTAGPRVAITVIEQRVDRGLWRGAAYSATLDDHLVNIPHQQMSLLPDAPDDFTDWLRSYPDPTVRRDYVDGGEGGRAARTVFVPRRLYGEYIEQHVQRCIDNASPAVAVDVVAGTAVGYEPATEAAGVVTVQQRDASGAAAGTHRVAYDTLVIATGNPDLPTAQAAGWFDVPADDGVAAIDASEEGAVDARSAGLPAAFVANTWDAVRDLPGALQRALELEAPVDRKAPLSLVLIGARLTAIDVTLALRHHGFSNTTVNLVSRGGRMPRANVGEFCTPPLVSDAWLRDHLQQRNPEVLRLADSAITPDVAGTPEAAARQATGQPLLESPTGSAVDFDGVARLMRHQLVVSAVQVPACNGNAGHLDNYGFDEAAASAAATSSNPRVPWHSIVDSVRPLENALWLSLGTEQRRAFIKTHRDGWEVYRHRVAPLPAAGIAAQRREGRFIEHAGGVRFITRLTAKAATGRALSPNLRVRLNGGGHVDAHAVLVCMGPSIDYRPESALAAEPSVVNALVAAGHIVPEANGMGLLCDPTSGRAVCRDAAGPSGFNYSDSVVVVGVPRRGSQWESIAVREIKEHASQAAAVVAAKAKLS